MVVDLERGVRRAHGAGGDLALAEAVAATTAAVAVEGVINPLDYMLAIVRDERADWRRRDDMAKAAAPYIHPRLTSVEMSGRVGGGGSNVSMDVQVYAVPRGARFGKDGSIVIEGEATELKPVMPFEGTPPLGLTDQSQPAPFEPSLPVIEVDVSNVTILRKRDEPA